MDTYIAILASFLLICGHIKYIRGIIKGTVVPTKSSWAIFSVVTGLSVSSFLATKFDVVSGAYGIADFALCLVVFCLTLFFSRGEKAKFKSFEKYYLIGAFACVLFWVVSNNSFVTNLLVQSLIVIGYFPTIHNILSTRKSSESKFAWTIWTMGVLLSLYPALVNRNTLAVVYSLRGTVMCLTILFLTHRFQEKMEYSTNREGMK